MCFTEQIFRLPLGNHLPRQECLSFTDNEICILHHIICIVIGRQMMRTMNHGVITTVLFHVEMQGGLKSAPLPLVMSLNPSLIALKEKMTTIQIVSCKFLFTLLMLFS